MTIVLTGGGSGGHITPVLAVAHELKQLKPGINLVYISQRGDSLADVPTAHPDIDAAYTVRGGKFRRYYGAGLKQLLNLPTLLKNIRDLGRVIIGFFESRRLLKKLKADAVFVKGGILGVPVGLAAASLRIPFITHDSDALPGLGHRIIGHWAKVHAVALPKETYAQYYPMAKTITVGVPISGHYKLVDSDAQKSYKKELGFEKYDKLLFITGGGNGAKLLNECVAKALPSILARYPDLGVVHVAGRLHEQKINQLYDELLSPAERPRVLVKGFIEDFYRYSGAADLIIARAGATNIAEFAVQAKACIIVPNPLLTGGHQLKNAQLLAEKQAVHIISEADIQDPSNLEATIYELFDSATLRQKLGHNLNHFAQPDAAKKLAELLLETAH
jgi:UDP-N-acetylglucosamine--N-acetylmuramyl-(pentapeptide) pyrophosphoryl-undecaprenol N-acetylglucosamine transferase